MCGDPPPGCYDRGAPPAADAPVSEAAFGERDLLARYIDQFAQRTGITPDFDRSFLYYRQQILHALAMWTITLCHSPLLPNMQPEDTTFTMIERITTAMADLDSIDSF